MIYRLRGLKLIRSREIIREYLSSGLKYNGIFLLSCGNAYHSLAEIAHPLSIKVIGLSTSHRFNGSVQLEDRLYTSQELTRLYPGHLNATPGALRERTMRRVGADIYLWLRSRGYHGERLIVPVGSGETITALSNYIPESKLVGFCCDDYPPIRFDYSPLKPSVETHFRVLKLDGLRSIRDASYLAERGESFLLTE